ncbi:MAG: 3'-5' exonuclease [Chromatiales bacterium]|nr:3'-5' exonuclease [Chromatiales bacterium]
MNSLVFDIETIPDVALGRRLLNLDGLSDEDVAKGMSFQRLQESGSEFLPLYQHRVVAISVVLRSRDGLRVWSLGEPDSDEAELVRRFFDGIDRYSPELVSWNGSGFDLPVLHYRGLLHRVQAARYWEQGDHDREFRYNNYLNRYHWRHVDVMDVLSAFQSRARAGLDQVATMLGFPGKMGLKGDKVWEMFLAGEIDTIRNYCETDVLNTWLVYLRLQYMRGLLDDESLDAELAMVRDVLAASPAPHLQEFLGAWQGNGSGQAPP